MLDKFGKLADGFGKKVQVSSALCAEALATLAACRQFFGLTNF